jgi:hypothetical protein
MEKHFLKLVMAAIILSNIVGNVCAQQTKRNLIANSCFEEGLKNWRWDGDLSYTELIWDTEAPISGQGSAKIVVYEQTVDSWGANLYYYMPLEEYVPYKLTFKAKASAEARMKIEVCESHGNATNYKPLEIISAPEGWIPEHPDQPLRGTFSLDTEVREYTFISDGNQFAYPNYTLAFHFGHADQGVSYWIDDIKLSRIDEGDWDGNLLTTGDFESDRPYAPASQGFWLDAQPDATGSEAYITADNAISGYKSAYFYKSPGAPEYEPFWALSYHLQFWNNEDVKYKLTFKAKSNLETYLMMRMHTQPWGFIPGDIFQWEVGLTTSVKEFRLDHGNTVNDVSDIFKVIYAPAYAWNGSERYLGKMSLFGSLLHPMTASEAEIWLDDFNISEIVYLQDYEVLNVPTSVETGKSAQIKIGEYLTPTHAPASVEFSVENNSGSATIDQNGNLTGVSKGTVTVVVDTPELTNEKRFTVNIVEGNSIHEVLESNIIFSKSVVSKGEDIIVTAPSPLFINIYTAGGTHLSSVLQGNIIQTQRLAAGVYIAKIQTGDGLQCVRRFIVK